MCQNESCVAKNDCYRFTATPNPRGQCYGFFDPSLNEKGEDFKCGYFAPNKETKK